MKSLFFLILLLTSFKGNAQLYFSQVNDSTFREGMEIISRDIIFPYDNSQAFCAREHNIPVYDSIVRLLEAHPGMKIELHIHSDSRGSEISNLGISQIRANMVKTCLTMERGIDTAQIVAIGKGESDPVIPEAEINLYKQTDKKMYEMLHAQNRRMVIRVVSY